MQRGGVSSGRRSQSTIFAGKPPCVRRKRPPLIPALLGLSKLVLAPAMRAGLLLLPCVAAFSGHAGAPPPRLRRSSSPLLQDVTRPARGTKGTADGEVVSGPQLSAEQLLAERPGPRVQVREVIDSMMAAVHRDYLNTPEHPFLGAL